MNPESDRVRARTAREILRRIDDETAESQARLEHAGPDDIARRLAELDAEWDTDRAVETEAATMGLLGLALATWLDSRFLALPAVVAASVLVHARTGHYPWMPVFRRLGVRTSKEIARERYALKALRGDFAMDAAARPDSDRRDAPRPATAPPDLH